MARLSWDFEYIAKIHSFFDMFLIFLKNVEYWGFSFLGIISNRPSKCPQVPPINFGSIFCMVTPRYEKILKVIEFDPFDAMGRKLSALLKRGRGVGSDRPHAEQKEFITRAE